MSLAEYTDWMLRLRRSEERLDAVQRIAHVGYWDRDLDAGRVTLSEEACRIFGLKPGPDLDVAEWHERWVGLIHPDDRPGIAEAAAAALRGGPAYDVEYRVVRPGGDVRIVHSRADVTWDDSGRPRRMFGVMLDVTELRRAEQELRSSEARFRTFVDHATDAFFLHDDELIVVDVNRRACESLGYDREELIGMHPRDFDCGHDAASLARLAERTAAGETVTFESLHRRKDGTVFPVEVRTGRFQQGERQLRLSLVRDITERKRAERELRRSETYLAQAQRLSHTGSFGWNASTGEIYWSDETHRIFELHRATPPTIEFVLERTHPDDRAAVEATIRRAQLEGSAFESEHRLLMPDGSVKHLHVVARPMADDEGQREFVGAIMDVTAQRRAEAERLAQESRYRTLVDFAADAIMLHSEDGTVVDVNRQACESLGYGRDELIGMRPAQFDGDLDAAALRRVAERIGAGEIVTFETHHRRKDGTVFPVEVRGQRLRIGDRWVGISVSRDITERRRAEDERERLRQAQADLARISRVTTMGEIAASLAHEIKQPITAAVTNARACIRWLARDRADLGEAREAAARIVQDAARAAEIIDRVRALYKRDVPRRDVVDVNAVVRETMALLRSEASRHSVSMHAELAPGLPPVAGDRVQLQQVLVNLMLNGIEAMDETPGVLTIASRPATDGELVITVSDEGAGLPAGKADAIFNAFFTTKPHGTGMGLAISRSIVSAHGGRLWATAGEGRGTTFHVALPTSNTAPDGGRPPP